MFNDKHKVLFRCLDCLMILSIEFDKEDLDNLENLKDNKMELECACGGICEILRD